FPPAVEDVPADDRAYARQARPLPRGAAVDPRANNPPPPAARYGSPGTYRDGQRRGYRDLPQQGGEGYDPYYGVPGGIPPGPAGSAEKDAIRRGGGRGRVAVSPENRSGPDGPPGTRSTQSSDPRNMAAFPPEVRPETGAKKELPPQFRRTLVDYRTKEPAGTIIVDTPNTHLYLVLGDGKALRYGVGVGREGFTWSGAERGPK